VWSTERFLRGAADIDEEVKRQCGPTPVRPRYSLFSSDVQCEVVLMDEEAALAQCKLERPCGYSISDAIETMHFSQHEAPGLTPAMAASESTASEARLPLLQWLVCVQHASLGRCYGCWCGQLEWTTQSPRVRKHIRAVHGGVTQDEDDDMVPDAAEQQQQQPERVRLAGGAANNLRAQLSPPASFLRQHSA